MERGTQIEFDPMGRSLSSTPSAAPDGGTGRSESNTTSKGYVQMDYMTTGEIVGSCAIAGAALGVLYVMYEMVYLKGTIVIYN